MTFAPPEVLRHPPRWVVFTAGLVVGLAGSVAAAVVPPASTLMPQNTVGFLSIPNAPEFRARWESTQVAAMARDESMRPFAEQFRSGMESRFGQLPDRVGVALDDMLAAAGGEVAVGLVRRPGERAIVVAMLDSTGRAAERDAMLQRVDERLRSRGAKVQTSPMGAASATTYTLPPTDRRPEETRAIILTQGDLVLASDDAAELRGMLDRAKAARGGLESSPVFQASMKRLAAESQSMPANVRWFLVPSEYDLASRSLRQQLELPEKKDILTMLREQGFDGIRGVAGYVHVAPDAERDFVHRTVLYAPPEQGAKGLHARDKYRLAMRVLELPNRANLGVQAWAPRMSAKYSTFSLDVLNAFDKIEPLFNAIAGYENAYRTTLDGFEKDPFSAQVNLRQEVVSRLGSRVTFVTDYRQPIEPDCERYLFVIEARDPAGLVTPINRLMEKDNAVQREIAGVPYWELLPEDQADTEVNYDGSLLPLEEEAPAAEPQAEERMLQRAAVCVHGDDLLVASDSEFLKQVLYGVETGESLAQSLDFQATMKMLDRVAPATRSGWAFVRTDEVARPTYELIRTGRMPEAESFFGRLVNKMLTTEEDLERGVVRRQRVNGSKLPSFESARRYFGPSARAVRTDADGWLVTGVVLSKAGG